MFCAYYCCKASSWCAELNINLQTIDPLKTPIQTNSVVLDSVYVVGCVFVRVCSGASDWNMELVSAYSHAAAFGLACFPIRRSVPGPLVVGGICPC